MKVFVYHTPELTPVNAFPDCAVVIDVLRATTTIATALGAGAEAVQTFSDLETLTRVSDSWPAEKRLRAGERGGAKVDGCDLGNSPLDCTPERVGGRRLFLSTTNGTRAIRRVEESPTVITASLINRQAAVKFLLDKQPDTLWIVGSGWEGGYSLEDTACAGAIARSLLDQDPSIEIGNDEVIASIALYSQWRDNLLGMFHGCSHGQRLLRLQCDEDLKYCASIDSLDVLPIQKEPSVFVKL